MDSTAGNYNSLATYDDGSCILVCDDFVGCTDPNATNYNPNATIDNGSCSYYVNGDADPVRNTGGGSNNNTNNNTGGNTGSTPITFTVQDSNDPDTNVQPPPNI